jgi:hypothetical protein
MTEGNVGSGKLPLFGNYLTIRKLKPGVVNVKRKYLERIDSTITIDHL